MFLYILFIYLFIFFLSLFLFHLFLIHIKQLSYSKDFGSTWTNTNITTQSAPYWGSDPAKYEEEEGGRERGDIEGSGEREEGEKCRVGRRGRKERNLSKCIYLLLFIMCSPDTMFAHLQNGTCGYTTVPLSLSLSSLLYLLSSFSSLSVSPSPFSPSLSPPFSF
jgi:hypothetical protein